MRWTISLGIYKTASFVQTALYLMNNDINIDYTIGIKTITLLNKMANKDLPLLLKLLSIQQGNIYITLAKNNPSQRKFIHGWINRLNMEIKNA